MISLDNVIRVWQAHNANPANSTPVAKKHIETIKEARLIEYADRQLLIHPGRSDEVEGRAVAYSLLKETTYPVLDNPDLLLLVHQMPHPEFFYPRKGNPHAETLFWRYVYSKDPLMAMVNTQSVTMQGEQSRVKQWWYERFFDHAATLAVLPNYIALTRSKKYVRKTQQSA